MFVVLAGVAGLVVTRGDLVEDDGEPTTFLLSGRAVVPRGQIHDDVFLLRGTATVAGTVEDDVVVVDGRARIDGIVHGDVIVLRGGATVSRRAEVDGDVRTSLPARIAEGADVRGSVSTAGPLDLFDAVSGLLWLGLWLATGLAVLVLALVAPGPVDEAARRGRARPGRSFLLGAVVLVLSPAVLGILALSVVGAVLAGVLACALVAAGWAGLTASGGSLGRVVLRHGGRGSLLLGAAALGVAVGLALLVHPVLALLASGAVLAHGLGSLVPLGEPTAPARTPEPMTFDDLLDDDPDPGPDPEAEADPVADDEPRVLAALPLSRN